MFRAGLLLIIIMIKSVQTAVGIVMRYVDWLLFVQSWYSWWRAARLLETCRGLLLQWINRKKCILLVHVIRMLQKIFKTSGGDATGCCRTLQNNLRCSDHL